VLTVTTAATGATQTAWTEGWHIFLNTE